MPTLPDKPGTVLYIGSGICSDLDRFQSLCPARIYLVEPNPDLELDLLRLQDRHDNVECLQFGVSENSCSATLNIPNLFDLSSFKIFENLKEFFPNGKLLKKARVPCVGVSSLLDQVEIDSSMPNILIIDTPGSSADLSSCFCNNERIQDFDTIILRDFTLPVFPNIKLISEVDFLFEKQGYAGGIDTANSSGNWQEYRYHKSTLVREPQKTKAELQICEDRLAKSNQENTAKETQKIESMQISIDSAQRTSEDALLELIKIQEEKDKLDTFLKEARSDLEVAQQELHAASNNALDLSNKVSKLERELAAEKDRVAVFNSDLQVRRNELETEKKELSEFRIELDHELTNLENEAAELDDAKNGILRERKEIDQIRQDLESQIEEFQVKKQAFSEDCEKHEAEKKLLAADQSILENSKLEFEVERQSILLRDSKLSDIANELSIEKTQVQKLERAASCQKSSMDELNKKYNETKKAHDDLLHENGTLHRLHALKDADLSELRDRYERLLASKSELDQALISVSNKMKIFIKATSKNRMSTHTNTSTEPNGSK